MNKKDYLETKPKVAYFCMEYGLDEELKIYSGGLGILAGDHIKAAKDEGVPLVAIGILWRQGYTKQTIDSKGRVNDTFPEYRYDFLEDTGVEVKIKIKGKQVKIKAYKCEKYGNIPLYLLDTFMDDNNEKLITGQLYGWFAEERIAQEMILGIGGVKVLKALGIEPDIYHFNEGHALFAGIELIREKMDDEGRDFSKSLEEVKRKIVFTTHTPVVAGNEVHKHETLKYLGAYNGLTYGQMVTLGGEPFNMTIASLRISKRANAVAQLHGETANKMWKDVDRRTEIIAITNGVHNKTWQDDRIVKAYEDGMNLMDTHEQIKIEMIKEIEKLNNVKLNPKVLTVGFARRAAPYKRSDLIFRNIDKFEEMARENKIQIIFSGKAHPNDINGKDIVTRLYEMSNKYPNNVVFLQNYDISIGKILTRGCDIWLNNPIKPKEASGTSGMKAAMNGVLNFSTLDGWWPEGCEHGVNGWQMGDGYEGSNHEEVDSKGLYNVLKEEIIPTYYENKKKWEKMMYESIKMSTDAFSASRMINEYYERMYSYEWDNKI